MPADPMANPVAEFEKLKSTDHSRSVENIGLPGHEMYRDAINKSGGTQFRDDGADPSTYYDFVAGPCGAIVDLSATFKFKATTDKPTEVAKAVQLGICNGTGEKKLFQIWIRAGGYTDVTGYPDIPSVRYDLAKQTKDSRPVRVRLTVVGNRFEVTVNSARLYSGPMLEPEATRELTGEFQARGVEGEITDFTWRTAGPRPEAPE
jgi:hypothetical protein